MVLLPKTGQTSCWDSISPFNAVACAGTGQDGDASKGTAWPVPRFTENGNGTLTDNLSGLIWLKDSSCFGEKNWQGALSSANSLAGNNSQCSLNDGSQVGDWRLPNRNELLSLVNYQQANNATWLNNQGFVSLQGAYYWTSDSYLPFLDSKWRVHMAGVPAPVVATDVTTNVIAVRGGQFGDSTVSVSPLSINFGAIAANAIAKQVVTITNSGTSLSRMHVNALKIGGTDATKFSLDKGDGSGGSCGSLTPILAPGSSCKVDIIFSANSSGSKSANLRISSSDVLTPNKDISFAGNVVSGKPGDCDNSDTVTIAEVQSAINMFLGLKTVEVCVDLDNGNGVSIAEVQKVINSFLGL